MKTTKEYSAGHSMATDWFAVDEDGNIAIICFEDNGPIPDEVPIQSFAIDNIFDNAQVKDGIKYFDIGSENAENLINLCQNQPFNECREGSFEGIIVLKEGVDISDININKKEWLCLSKPQKLFYLSFVYDNDYVSLVNAYNTHKIAYWQYADLGSIFNDEEEYSDDDTRIDCRKLGMFVYQQNYSPLELTKRIAIPKMPVKIQDFPVLSKQNLLNFRGKFIDFSYMQPMDFGPCNRNYMEFNCVSINGYGYYKLKSSDNKTYKLYRMTNEADLCEKIDSCKRCTESGCTERNNEYCKSFYYWPSKNYPKAITDFPPVMVILDNYYQNEDDKKLVKDLNKIMQYLQIEDEQIWQTHCIKCFADGNIPEETQFLRCQNLFEWEINLINPLLIVATPKQFEILIKFYQLSNNKLINKLTIANRTYPLIISSNRRSKTEINTLRDFVKEILQQPHIHIELPRILDDSSSENHEDTPAFAKL